MIFLVLPVTILFALFRRPGIPFDPVSNVGRTRSCRGRTAGRSPSTPVNTRMAGSTCWVGRAPLGSRRGPRRPARLRSCPVSGVLTRIRVAGCGRPDSGNSGSAAAQRSSRRARIVLLAGDGVPVREIVARVGCPSQRGTSWILRSVSPTSTFVGQPHSGVQRQGRRRSHDSRQTAQGDGVDSGFSMLNREGPPPR